MEDKAYHKRGGADSPSGWIHGGQRRAPIWGKGRSAVAIGTAITRPGREEINFNYISSRWNAYRLVYSHILMK